MKAAVLSDRSVIKVAGDDARNFLHGLVSADILKLAPGEARFCALLSPQGKIVADFFVVEAPAHDGGGFFLDVPRALAKSLVDKLNLYKLRAQNHDRGFIRGPWRSRGMGWIGHDEHRPLLC